MHSQSHFPLSLSHTHPINPHRHAAVPSHRFGCPYLASSRRTVLVSPFPASTVARGSPQPEEAAAIEWLSPELAVLDTTVASATVEVSIKRAGMRQLLRDALSSNPREQVQEYYNMGRKDAELWLKTSEFYRTVRGGGGGGGGGWGLRGGKLL